VREKMNKKQEHFLFYFVLIFGAIVLFKGITTYGETQLHAAPKITGNYSLSTSLPCLENKHTILKVEQSGLYVFGDLVFQNPNEINLPLSGTMTHEVLSISTQESNKIQQLLAECPSSVTQNYQSLSLIGTLETNGISGMINIADQHSAIDFTAKKEESKTRPQEAH